MKKLNFLALCSGLCLSCTPLVAMESFSPQPKAHSKTIQGLLPKETYKARAAHFLYCVFFGESLDKPLEIATAKWEAFIRQLPLDPELKKSEIILRIYLSSNIERIQQSKDNYYKTQLEGYLRERKANALYALAHYDLIGVEDAHIQQTTVIESMYRELSCDPHNFDPIIRIPYFFTLMVTQNLECGLLANHQREHDASQPLKATEMVEMSHYRIATLRLIESIEFAQAILDLINPLEAID
jgi:hypothetical protein